MKTQNTMNKWQKVYADTYYNGKKPRSASGKQEFELLGMIQNYVTVEFPERNGEPAHKETYKVVCDRNECNMPNGIIDACYLAGNLVLWLSRGYRVTTNTVNENE